MTRKIIVTLIIIFCFAAPARPAAKPFDFNPAPSDTVELTSLRHWPQPTKQVPPVYPEQARIDLVEAEVALSVLIGKDGVPKNVRVLKVATSFMKDPSVKKAPAAPGKKYAKLFRQPSVDAVMKWRFTRPLKQDSAAALVWVNVPLKYQLTTGK